MQAACSCARKCWRRLQVRTSGLCTGVHYAGAPRDEQGAQQCFEHSSAALLSLLCMLLRRPACLAEGKQRERARYFRGRARLLEGSFEAAAEDLETVVRSGLVGDTEVDPPRRVAQLLLQAQDGARAKRRRLS